jgi:hypothetical protein
LIIRAREHALKINDSALDIFPPKHHLIGRSIRITMARFPQPGKSKCYPPPYPIASFLRGA